MKPNNINYPVKNYIIPKHFDSVPIELHGHRKKLKFFWRNIETYKDKKKLLNNDVRILEIGCSNGINVSIPLSKCNYNVTGIDMHSPSIQHAKSLSLGTSARFLNVDLFDFGSDERFDIIILSDVLEHVHDPLKTCLIASKHLLPDGLIMICIPNGFGPYENEHRLVKLFKIDKFILFLRNLKSRVLRKKSQGPAYNYESGHIQFFHLNEFTKLLSKAGLSIKNTQNGALFGGPISYGVFNRIPFCAFASLILANILPKKWVTTWYFCCSVKDIRSRPDGT